MSNKIACEYADAEIASQPSIWAQVADFAPTSLHLLPEKGEKVAVVGCGSSWFMSMASHGKIPVEKPLMGSPKGI